MRLLRRSFWLRSKQYLHYVRDLNKTTLENKATDQALKEKHGIQFVSKTTENAKTETATQNPDGQLDNLFNYAANPEKTVLNEKVLVGGVGVGGKYALIAFKKEKDRYEKLYGKQASRQIHGTKSTEVEGVVKAKEPIDAYHVIQSFPESVKDPELVHKLGLLYAERAFPGHKCLVATHMNTDHLHNHIIVCAYHESGTHKFKMDTAAYRKMQQVNDTLSREYDLPVLEESIDEPLNMVGELSRFGEGNITSVRDLGETAMRKEKRSWKLDLEQCISENADNAASWADFKNRMEDSGWLIRETEKNITYINRDNPKRRARGAPLGQEYTKENICLSHDWGQTITTPVNTKSPQMKIRFRSHRIPHLLF